MGGGVGWGGRGGEAGIRSTMSNFYPLSPLQDRARRDVQKNFFQPVLVGLREEGVVF